MKKTTIFLFAILCILVSCNTEEIDNNEQNSIVATTSKWFDESGGLKGTTSWNALSTAKQNSIINTYNSWRTTTGSQCN